MSGHQLNSPNNVPFFYLRLLSQGIETVSCRLWLLARILIMAELIFFKFSHARCMTAKST